jgi:hypothetical protein
VSGRRRSRRGWETRWDSCNCPGWPMVWKVLKQALRGSEVGAMTWFEYQHHQNRWWLCWEDRGEWLMKRRGSNSYYCFRSCIWYSLELLAMGENNGWGSHQNLFTKNVIPKCYPYTWNNIESPVGYGMVWKI